MSNQFFVLSSSVVVQSDSLVVFCHACVDVVIARARNLFKCREFGSIVSPVKLFQTASSDNGAQVAQ